jgi:hypothetical protein
LMGYLIKKVRHTHFPIIEESRQSLQQKNKKFLMKNKYLV